MRFLRAIGRALVIAIARLVFGKPRARALGEVRRVLVIRTDERVGNVLLTIPLLRALRCGLPEAEIVFLHAASKGALVQGLAHVDRLEPFEKRDFFRRPWRFFGKLARLRRARFDVAIEAGHYHAFSLTAALLGRFVRPRILVGHDRGLAKWFFDYPVPPPADEVQDVAVKLSLLGPMGLSPAGRELETPLASDEAERDRMRAQLVAEGVDPDRLLVINPGARMAVRRWEPAHYGALAVRLAEAHGLEPLILWGPGEEALAREVVAHSGGKARLAPPTDLRQLAALLSLARAFVTNDTGPMHLGVACGVPTVAIFLATDPKRWGHPDAAFVAVDLREGDEQGVERILHAATRLFPSPEKMAG